jgi:biopolymer transport protein ExbD
MLVHKKKRSPYQVHVPLTSLIDIVFLLLIYFLLTTNFLTEAGIDVKLPEAVASKEKDVTELVIYIDKEGDILFQGEKVEENELLGRLKSLVLYSKDPLLTVKADRELALGKAVKVMDIARLAGINKLSLATERPKELH